MAISPQQVKVFDVLKADKLEELIDDVLRIRGNHSGVSINLKENYSENIRKEIQRRYVNVGWKEVTFSDWYGIHCDPCESHTVNLYG